MKQLLVGCGSSREKKMWTHGTEHWDGLFTLDNNPLHNPDLVWDLLSLPLPFEDNTFDEIHAYEVLEHTGQQGDYRFFFKQWSEFWRILKPNGLFFATVPSITSVWAYGDPSHTRVITPESLFFLCQPTYDQVGKTSMSDFRHIYKADFDIGNIKKTSETVAFILKAVKPSRLNHGN